MKKNIVLIVVLLCSLVSCKSNETIVPEVSGIENSIIEESSPAGSETEAKPDKTQSQNEDFTSSHVENNISTEQLTPETDYQQLPVYNEQALVDFLTYLEQSLTDVQHGGLHRVSDFNGSGLYIHGGPDKADPYIVVWVIDKNAIERAEESYTGPKVDIVHIDAPYSMNQLNSIMNELENSEIAPYINGLALSADNMVMIDVIGKDNQDKVDSFLQSYKYNAAVSLFSRPGNGINPVA